MKTHIKAIKIARNINNVNKKSKPHDYVTLKTMKACSTKFDIELLSSHSTLACLHLNMEKHVFKTQQSYLKKKKDKNQC